MCCVKHEFFETDYNTLVCHRCGVEKATYLKPAEGYTQNVPLDPGYSRHHRMSSLLKQLFRPRHYGIPNSEVVFHAIKNGPFKNGEELLLWLSKIKVKHKQYSNAHYYFAIASPEYNVSTPPTPLEILTLERKFHEVQSRFMNRKHSYKSFFSYNWLLHKLLHKHPFYLQFVKRIKCKKRIHVYQTMWEFFMSSNNVLEDQGVSPAYQKSPVVPREHVSKRPREEQLFLDRIIRNYQNN